MGCTTTKNVENLKVPYSTKVQEFIDQNESKKLDLVVNPTILDIDDLIYVTSALKLSPLAYALFQGKAKSFIHLHKFLNASIAKMEDLLTSQGISPILMACKHGNLELFSYYLENRSDGNNPSNSKFDPKQTLAFTDSDNLENRFEAITPMHLICELGYVHILSYLVKYTKRLSEVPEEFDIEHPNEITGENCALIACRNGNYILIKFLNNIGANFEHKNKLGENALQVLCSSNNKKPLKEMYECFAFLIFTCGVDLTYNYEETFLLNDDPKIIVLLETKLQEKGIFTTKQEVDEKYKYLMEINDKQRDPTICEARDVNFASFIREINRRTFLKSSMGGCGEDNFLN